MRKLFYILLFTAIPMIMKAVVAYPFPIEVHQKDGSVITILLSGNEWKHRTNTLDGYEIEQNQEGIYFYKNSKVKAHNPEFRSITETDFLQNLKLESEIIKTESLLKVAEAPTSIQAGNSFPRTGSPKSIVILVNFSDTIYKTANAQTAFNRLLNEVGYSDNGATGSSKDYFISSSYGKFSPDFDVVGPYTLPNPMSYYGSNKTDGNDSLPANMIVDACKVADQNGIDFTNYDLDNDGYIDNVFVYYAGHNEAEGGGKNTIWPHRWAVVPGNNYKGSTQSIKFDGKKLYSYACTSELKRSTGTLMCGIGTFTHEFGHVIGMVDYYHTASSTYKKTLEYWSIMDIGVYLNEGRTPPVYSSYDRFYLGWLTPKQIDAAGSYTLNPISQDTSSLNQAYLFADSIHNLNGEVPSPFEFFLVEYRKNTGWDSYLKGRYPANYEGMLIWHIDFNQAAWDENGPNNYTGVTQSKASHMRIYLQPLSGNLTTPGAPYSTGSFTPILWAGDTINRKLTNITMKSDKITFDFMGGLPPTQITAGLILNTINFPNSRVGIIRQKNLQLKSPDFTQDAQIVLEGMDATSFGCNVNTATTAELSAGKEVILTYNPSQTGSHNATLKISNGSTVVRTIELKGKCE